MCVCVFFRHVHDEVKSDSRVVTARFGFGKACFAHRRPVLLHFVNLRPRCGAGKQCEEIVSRDGDWQGSNT